MTKIVVNYDPFAMESQILTIDEVGTTGTTYSNSELSQLAESIAYQASVLGPENVKVFVGAPQVFYSKLASLVKTAQKTYALADINMERI